MKPGAVRIAAAIVGLAALAGTIVPPLVFMLQSLAAEPGGTSALSLDAVKAIMLVATLAWFAAAPWWMTVD